MLVCVCEHRKTHPLTQRQLVYSLRDEMERRDGREEDEKKKKEEERESAQRKEGRWDKKYFHSLALWNPSVRVELNTTPLLLPFYRLSLSSMASSVVLICKVINHCPCREVTRVSLSLSLSPLSNTHTQIQHELKVCYCSD